MKKTITIIAIIALAIGAYYFFKRSDMVVPRENIVASDSASYANAEYGISFEYPEGYVVTDGLVEGETGRYVITLVRSEDSGPRENGEGPTAVTIDIYSNAATTSLAEWLETPASNLGLSNGTYASTTVDGIEAVNYRWSGLYEGETTAFLHDDRIIAVSVTYLTIEDENIGTYQDILRSMQIDNQSI